MSTDTRIPTHGIPDGFVMNHRTCGRAANAVQWAMRKLFSLTVNPVGGKSHLNDGDIFLLNHFTRFETIIASYLLYRTTGHFVRSLADKSLFNVHRRFSAVLRAVGVVPNDMPGILPFFAAEIMRGNKVLIFPEGGMVKDKHVQDAKGNFAVHSSVAQRRRKHHKGAAVLGIILDLFKYHLRDLEKKKDWEQLDAWVAALGVESRAILLERAHKPTLLVPGNITYFPIRNYQNWLSWLVEKLAGEEAIQALEEVIVEGNILFKPTDMDIRFGEPVQAHPELSRIERMSISSQLESMREIPYLFNLRNHTESAGERRLQSFIDKHSTDLRERYMRAIYGLTTLNMNHLISTMFDVIHKKGLFEIPQTTFHTAMYLALKDLQSQKDINLHCSLTMPWRYEELLTGHGHDFRRFIKICEGLKLIKKVGTVYRISHRLDDVFDSVDVRIENPIAVHTNEAATVSALRHSAELALAKVNGIAPQVIGQMMFSDMVRDYRLRWGHYSQKYPATCPTLKEPDDGAPYLLVPKGAAHKKTKLGVVLVHGFTASPKELRAMGDEIYANGHVVLGVRLPGHGTSPYDMDKRTRHDWNRAVENAYRIVADHAEKVVLLGYSTGGLAAFNVAGDPKHQLAQLAGVISVSVPIVVQDKAMNILPLIMGLRWLLTHPFGWGRWFDKWLQFYGWEKPDGVRYGTKPTRSLNELRKLIAETPAKLEHIHVPTMVIQGTADETVAPHSADVIFNGLIHAQRERHTIEGGSHRLIENNEGLTRPLIHAFLARMAGAGR